MYVRLYLIFKCFRFRLRWMQPVYVRFHVPPPKRLQTHLHAQMLKNEIMNPI